MPSSPFPANTVGLSISRTFTESSAAIEGAATGYFCATFHSPNGVLVAQLIGEALAVFDEDGPRARGYIERADFILRGRYPVALPGKGILADWQVRKVVQHIHGNLEAELRMSDAAKVVNLSTGHFSRSFKMTTGLTYSQYVIQARIGLAKQLLQTSKAPISEIALMCGLPDQPHLNRLFRRLVCVPPSTWRRMMAEPPENAK